MGRMAPPVPIRVLPQPQPQPQPVTRRSTISPKTFHWKPRNGAPGERGARAETGWQWLASAHIAGRGDFTGEVAIEAGSTADDFTTRIKLGQWLRRSHRTFRECSVI